jgi:hypothetical protein
MKAAKSLLAATIAAATLSGCVSLPPYVAPAAGEPTAIVDTSRVQPTSICSNGTLYSVKAPRDNKLVVPANGRVAIYTWVELYDYNVTYSCGPGVSFQPAKGASYLLNLQIEDQKCLMEVYRQGGQNRTGLDIEPSAAGPQFCNTTVATAAMKQQSDSLLSTASQKPGAVVLPSGVRYVPLEAGGDTKPAADATLELELRGETAAGRLFLDTAATNKPMKIKASALPLAGLREAVALMPVGARWEIYLPADQAWGDALNSPVGPGQAVKFVAKVVSAE